jgi:hypothetical protein
MSLLSALRLTLEIRHPPQRPLGSQLKTQKWRIVPARQNLLVQKAAQVHWHSESCLFTQVQSVHDWLILHVESEGGVDSNFSVKMELSEQEPRTASS